MHLAFITSRSQPGLTADDLLAAAALRARACSVTAVPWDEPGVDWAAFDVVVLRSCWDYHLRLREFEAWLDGLERRRCPVVNHPSLVRWNSHKRYLGELSRAGSAVVPTVLLCQGAGASLADLACGFKAATLVIKPAVSASAHATWLAAPTSRADIARFEAALESADLLVQPFLKEIAERGEWSLVFFAGRLHHAVLKRPALGEWRVHQGLGGTAVAAAPPRKVIAAAYRAVEAAPRLPVYARADLIEVGRRPLVSELELIEPELFLSLAPGAAMRFAAVLVAEHGGRSHLRRTPSRLPARRAAETEEPG